MRSLISILVILTALTAFACAEPLTIIIVTSDSNESERGYTEFLRDIYRGTVEVRIEPGRYEEDLSSTKKLELESADLIIVSRDNLDTDYNADAEFWNDLNVPILNHNIKLARCDGHDYWDWLAGDDTSAIPLTHLTVADPNDPIFAGVDTSSGTVEIFAVAVEIDHSDQSSAGNGTVIATSDGDVVIARWLGNETAYYEGSDYAPGGPRVFFAMPRMTYDFFDNATDQATLMLKNAILSLLPIYRPRADLDYDRDVDFSDFALFAGYWGDSGCVEGVACAEADFTGDANIAAGDLALFAEEWLDGADATPPEPNVMTWQTEPMTLSTTSIYMAAAPASDAQYGVEYYFQCLSGEGPDSSWQYANTFEPNTLTLATQYTYRVKARDTSSRLNETQWSDSVTVWTFGMYREIADASAAAALDANLFIAAGDETNRLSIYDSNEPASRQILDFNLTDYLDIDMGHPESDIEGATWFNGRIFWITSHGRNREGKYWPSRYRFFATTVSQAGPDANITVDGYYSNLIDDLIDYDATYNLGLADAIGVIDGNINPEQIPDLAPKEHGLNIEGLCAAADGNSMFIAFRNPRPDVNDVSCALIIRLNNPEQVVLNGLPADFEPPLLLNLDGFGIRSMEYSPTLGRYLIVAGSHRGGADSPLQILYSYDMTAGILTMIDDFPIITPEAMFQFPDSNDIQVLSDDGVLMIDTPEGPVLNKTLPREQRTFRTQVVSP
ncbi:MAG TPA: DUF3616 domain-containing protein [Sedimentisphaerales bacterium]|nr:DUF3616 domain-containing protein [Sedimentisphaerales bacterium]